MSFAKLEVDFRFDHQEPSRRSPVQPQRPSSLFPALNLPHVSPAGSSRLFGKKPLQQQPAPPAAALDWEVLCRDRPELIQQVQQDLIDIADGQLTWAEALQVPDEQMLGMARKSSTWIEQGLHAQAERVCRALTLLDPFVPWFWLALGDVLRLQSKTGQAIDAYRHCIDEGLQCDPPAPEVAPASLRAGTLLAQAGRHEEALPDLARAVEHDRSGSDGRQSFLALRHLVETGKLPAAALDPLIPLVSARAARQRSI